MECTGIYRKLTRRGEFLHFDPIKGMNKAPAQEMVNKLNKIEKAVFQRKLK